MQQNVHRLNNAAGVARPRYPRRVSQTNPDEASTHPQAQPPRRRNIVANPTIQALLAIVFFTYIGQNMLNVSIGPLSRALGLVDWAIGLAVSVAAVMVALLAQFWGRHLSIWGRRRVLVISLTFAFLAGITFAGGVWLKKEALIGAVFATGLIILARGVFFGAAVSGIPPAAQSLIAELTPDEPSRVRGMAAFSGANNLSIMIGSFASAALGAWWIFAPVYATPFLVGIALLVAIFAVPRTPRVPGKKLPAKMRFSDPRILPWVLSVVGLFFANGVVQIIVSFALQDRLLLTPEQSIAKTGWALLVISGGAMFAQLIVLPRLGWRPQRLLRIGLTLAVATFTTLSLAQTFWLFLVAGALNGFANGMVGPAFAAGGSLAVQPEEQGALAGLQHATGALTWILAPVSATTLYSWHPWAPFILAGTLLYISAIIAWLHPRLS